MKTWLLAASFLLLTAAGLLHAEDLTHPAYQASLRKASATYPTIFTPGTHPNDLMLRAIAKVREMAAAGDANAAALLNNPDRPMLLAGRVSEFMALEAKAKRDRLAALAPKSTAAEPTTSAGVVSVQKIADGVYMGIDSNGKTTMVQQVADGVWMPIK